MNIVEQLERRGAGRVQDDKDQPGEMEERARARAELVRRFEHGLAVSGLTKAQLAARTRLGRTTVHNAFSSTGPLLSLATIGALAKAMQLPVVELLDLQRRASLSSDVANGDAAGPEAVAVRPVAEQDASKVVRVGLVRPGAYSFKAVRDQVFLRRRSLVALLAVLIGAAFVFWAVSHLLIDVPGASAGPGASRALGASGSPGANPPIFPLPNAPDVMALPACARGYLRVELDSSSSAYSPTESPSFTLKVTEGTGLDPCRFNLGVTASQFDIVDKAGATIWRLCSTDRSDRWVPATASSTATMTFSWNREETNSACPSSPRQAAPVGWYKAQATLAGLLPPGIPASRPFTLVRSHN